MKVSELFVLHQGNSFELINMEVDRQSEINFVARTGENNGVTARVKAVDAVAPFPAGCITVALGGSVLSAFVQFRPFYTGFHVMALIPRGELMKVNDLFDIKYGINLELNACEITTDKDGINFIARTAENNGVVAKVKPIAGKIPQPTGVLTCASGGSVLSTFVQSEPFYSGRDLYILTPKTEMRLEEKLFYCHCIKMNTYRYRYGRQANKTLKDIDLPELPEWLLSYTIDYSRITTGIKKKELSLNISMWKKFKMDDIFIFYKGKRIIKEDMTPGDTNFVASIDNNNGIREKIDIVPAHQGNCITVNYNGSVGEAFYQNIPFCASDDVNILYPNNWTLNKYIGLFLVTIIRFNKYRFGYGRKWTLNKMKETVIALPSTDNNVPDWQFMENYIKALPYSDKI
jgi:hypothetical protein